MGKVCVTEDYLQDIADAIREKGVEGTFTPAQMGDAVRQISGGGGGFDISKIKVLNAYKTNTIPSSDSDCMLTKFYIESISSTDYKMSLFTYTATNDCKVIFSSWSQARTNTGSNEGYISVEVNGVQKFKKYLTTDTQMAVNFPASFNLEANDVLTLNVGFDNAHTNCRWYIQTYPVVVEDVSGGGGVAIINRLFNGCESQYTSDSSSTPQLLDSYTDGADFSSYISTSDHKTFTVLQDFVGIVTVGIMQDKDRSTSNKPNCTFFLNNNEYYSVDAQNSTSGSASKTKGTVMVEFETGDTFFWGSNNGSGWPVRLGALDLIDSIDMSGYVDPDWT